MENGPARGFRDLVVWQKAHEFVLEVYKYTMVFPKYELYGLVSQLRRSAVSIPANIAEGFAKQGRADKARFYNIAQGSIAESQYYLILSRDLGYGDPKSCFHKLSDTSKLLNSYCRKLRNQNQTRQ